MTPRRRKRSRHVMAGEIRKAGDRPVVHRRARVEAAKPPKAPKLHAALKALMETPGLPARVKSPALPGRYKLMTSPPNLYNPMNSATRLVTKDGVVYVVGCSTPVWRLEMARRAGSAAAALIHAFPGLSLEGLERAYDYARKHRAEIDRLIRKYGPGEVPSANEPDDGEGFEQEMKALADRDAELYRRLAQ